MVACADALQDLDDGLYVPAFFDIISRRLTLVQTCSRTVRSFTSLQYPTNLTSRSWYSSLRNDRHAQLCTTWVSIQGGWVLHALLRDLARDNGRLLWVWKRWFHNAAVPAG